jgi:hypothetical protein
MPARASLLVQPRTDVHITDTGTDVAEKHWAVLTSLKRLTKRDFGFDQAAWRNWWAANHRQSSTNSEESSVATSGK